jgi:hypothetical protein
MAVPGQLQVEQHYADAFRGWPVAPQHEQHPVRGSFNDPRPDPDLGAIYHDGLDVAVRDDRPEAGAPKGRTHRVYAIEGGRVVQATPHGERGLVDIGHFRYEHVDALVTKGQAVEPGQVIGWTTQGTWHVHLGEWVFLPDGSRLLVNPLRPGGKVAPFADSAPPEIHELRYYTPATPAWARRPANVALYPQAGKRLDKTRLSGVVDVRVRTDDPQSYIGWFSDLPWLAAPHHPFGLSVRLTQVSGGHIVLDREVFRNETAHTVPAGQHFAPGTEQNLPADGCMTLHRTVRCRGTYWFRVFPKPYWDTRNFANGRYRLRVAVRDAAGNESAAETVVTIAN